MSCPVLRGDQTWRGQEREHRGLRHGALEGVHAAVDGDLRVDLAAAAGQAGAQLAVAGDVGERGGERPAARGSGSSALRPRSRRPRRRRPRGCRRPGGRRRPPRARPRRRARRARARRRRRRPRRPRGAPPGRCSRRIGPGRRAAPRAPAARRRGARCRRCGARPRSAVRPLRANASISPPTFLSGTSRATVGAGRARRARAGAAAARIGSGSKDWRLTSTASGAAPSARNRSRAALLAAMNPCARPTSQRWSRSCARRQPFDDPRRVLAEDHERDAAAGAPGPRAQRGRPVLPGDDHVGAERAAPARGRAARPPACRPRARAGRRAGGPRRTRAGRETTPGPDPSRPVCRPGRSRAASARRASPGRRTAARDRARGRRDDCAADPRGTGTSPAPG